MFSTEDPKEISTGQLDVLLSGQPIWVIAGPVTAGRRAAIKASLLQLSRHDPIRRVGLVPTIASRSWSFSPDMIRGAIMRRPESMTPPVDTTEGISATLNSLLRSDHFDQPMAVIPYGDFVAFRFDHGLGDAHVLMKIIAQVSGSGTRESVVSATADEPNVSNPALWALANTVKSRPAGLTHSAWAVLRDKALQLSRRPPRRSSAGHSEADAGDADHYGAVFVRSGSDFVARARRYRAAHDLDISVSGLTMYWICQSLRAAGIAVAPVTEVLVDLRRYLPRGRQTWANFTAVARIPLRPSTTPEQFGDMLSTHLNSTRPLVEMLAGVAKSRLLTAVGSGPHSDGWRAGRASPTGEATVVFSDISRVPSAGEVHWSPRRRPTLAVALPPASRSNISMLLCSPSPGEIQVTASLFPSEFDVRTVRRALRDALGVPGAGTGRLRYGTDSR
jgi:hypothetical protein